MHQLGSLRPWDHRGKCYNGIEREFNACKTPRCIYPSMIYLQPFLRYSKLLVENCHIFIPHLCLAAPRGWPRRNFAKILIFTKLEWMGYRVVKKSWQYIKPFWYSTSVWRTDRRTDVQPISITCFSIADARKNVVIGLPVTDHKANDSCSCVSNSAITRTVPDSPAKYFQTPSWTWISNQSHCIYINNLTPNSCLHISRTIMCYSFRERAHTIKHW